METQMNIFFITIGIVITVPFIFLCYKFNEYNQYKNTDSWIKMLSWFVVMVYYWLMYFTI